MVASLFSTHSLPMSMANVLKGVAEFFTPVLTTSAFYEVNGRLQCANAKRSCLVSRRWHIVLVFRPLSAGQ